MRNLIKNELKKAGYEVIGEAKDGKEGVKRYFELKPDFVTMDIKMPVMDGIEATKQILSKDPDALIVAVTGASDDETKDAMMRAGAKSYLVKPFQPAFLLSRIEALVDGTQVVEPVHVPEPKNEAVDDDFFEEEFELHNEPIPSEAREIVIENEHSDIEFPIDYTAEIELEEYALTKEKVEEEARIEQERLERERMEQERIEKERLERERLEQERLERERQEQAKLDAMDPQERLNQWRLEQIRIAEDRKKDEAPADGDFEIPTSAPKEDYDPLATIRPPRAQIQQSRPPHMQRDYDDETELEEPVIQISPPKKPRPNSPSAPPQKKKAFGFLSNLFKK